MSVRGVRPVGIVPGCVALVCVGLLLATLNVLQGGNEVIIVISGAIFVVFASYVAVAWLLDAFKGRG
jgi:hypothetical protein